MTGAASVIRVVRSYQLTVVELLNIRLFNLRSVNEYVIAKNLLTQ